MRKLTAFLSVICLSSILPAQLVVTPDTTICAGGTATLAVISSPSYGTSSYTFEVYPYSPETYAGTSPIQAGGGGLTDDSYSTAVPLGFTFCFLGNQYTQCYIGSNGWVSFGGPGALVTTFTSAAIPSVAGTVPKNCIMGPWQDWHPGLCTPVGSCIKYQTIGTAPNRKFVVSWDNVPMFSCTGLYGKFQIVLNETTNVIENHLTNKPNCMAWAGGTATQGVHSGDGLTAFTAPGRNSTPWTTTNESTRFVPNGIIWYDPAGAIVGYGDSLIVSPTVTTTYTAFLESCSGTDYTADIVVTVDDPDPSFSYDPFYCTTGYAMPTVTGDPGGTFAAVPAGMVIDPVTGEIDLNASTPGSYSVSYTAYGITGDCPSETAVDLVTIVVDPDASFGYSDINYCPTGTTTPTFITTAGGTFSVSPAGLTVNPTTGVVNLTTGTIGTTYTITYTVGILCVSTYSVTITITDFDDPSVNYPAPSYCPTGTATPTVATPGGTYTVSPAGLVVNPTTGVVDLTTGTVGTTYTITYTTPTGPCSNSTTTTITIDPLDDPTFSYSAPSYCPTGTTLPTSITTPGGTFSIFPTTMGINSTTGMLNLASGDIGTTYTITYTTPAGPCSNSSTETVTIDPLDDPGFTYDAASYCNYGTAIVTSVETPGGNFTVSPATLSINALTGAIDLTTGIPGSFYTITYTTPAGPCSNSTSVVIEIMPLTDAAFSYLLPAYCATGTTLPNMILNPGGTFSAMAGISINAATGELNLAACTPGGPYEIYYTSPGCPEVDTVEVTIYPLPTPTIDLIDVICLEGDPTLIIGDPAGGTFSGEGVIGDEFDPALAGDLGLYTVTYTYTDANGCTNNTTGAINVIQNDVDAGIDQYIPEYTTTVITATGGTTFLWEPPAGLSCTDCPAPVFDSLLSQTYMVTSWDAFGCIDSDMVTITVVPVFDPVVFVPNTFTPNGDNINDYFFAYGTDLASIVSMNIYDRWGELIFTKENMIAGNPSAGWDGTYNEEPVAQGVYAFMLIVQLEDGMKQHMQGNITLIR
ncbi:MAG: gliding motility-associated C-terminal domain-containing protein [Chitinophagales bacterium]|nr:gliding motility-associated C-terminal domain-containing protein [Chitinophagales bacterium]HMZ88250.1 gliding motility-associated C-terminal domain-containing protein [Chitinophagales bacterium]